MQKNELITQSGLSIYDEIPTHLSNLFYTAQELEIYLEKELLENNYGELPLRTRSKIVNQDICKALGYPVPSSFKKTKPRFISQNFDKYVQKANNLQVWNEELDPSRRYAIIRLNEGGTVTKVRVVTGNDLSKLDTTGTLTQKYQARLDENSNEFSKLLSITDTETLKNIINKEFKITKQSNSPTDKPSKENLLPIADIYNILEDLVSIEFKDSGFDQERNRGELLHRIICDKLGYSNYADNGRFPDIKNQLLEIKLQTSPTIDLGLVLPSSENVLDDCLIDGIELRHCDVRYAVFYGNLANNKIKLTKFYLTTGLEFFTYFIQFKGKVLNKKLQIPLPSNFFDL